MSNDKTIMSERDRAKAIVEKVIKDHAWSECGFQGTVRSLICPMLKGELQSAYENAAR